MTRYIDITRPVDGSLPLWPGRAPPIQNWEKRLNQGNHCNASSWQMSSHTGTHMDAPLHFIDGAASIDQVPPEVFFGDCMVVDLRLEPDTLMDIELASRCIGVKRLLLRTHHSIQEVDGGYEAHNRQLSPAAASILLENGLGLLGTDRLSVDDSEGRDYALHRLILGAGCVILEGLLMPSLDPGDYFLHAAPLLLSGMEASPIRAFLTEK